MSSEVQCCKMFLASPGCEAPKVLAVEVLERAVR